MGMTTELMNKIAGAITVYSKQQGINITTAPRDVLRALPGATPEQVDEFIAARKDALASGLPLPPFPASNGYANPPSPVWRIHAEARMPDGVTFARDAVLRQLGDPRRPFLILAWQVGGLSPKPEPSTTGPDALQKNGTGKL